VAEFEMTEKHAELDNGLGKTLSNGVEALTIVCPNSSSTPVNP
jgi:hypothetical protein